MYVIAQARQRRHRCLIHNEIPAILPAGSRTRPHGQILGDPRTGSRCYACSDDECWPSPFQENITLTSASASALGILHASMISSDVVTGLCWRCKDVALRSNVAKAVGPKMWHVLAWLACLHVCAIPCYVCLEEEPAWEHLKVNSMISKPSGLLRASVCISRGGFVPVAISI